MNNLKELLSKIDYKINELESIDIEYKTKETKFLEEICRNNSFLNIDLNISFKPSELLACSIIINEQYTDFDVVMQNIKDIEEEIDKLSGDNLMKMIGCCLGFEHKKFSEKILEEMRKKFKKMGITSYEKFERLARLADTLIIGIIPLIKLIEETKDDILEINNMLNNIVDVDKTFKESIDIYNVPLVKENLSRINHYYVLLESENNKKQKEIRKKINKLSKLRKILESTENIKEITNISEISGLLEEDLREDVLKYISTKNKVYYIELEKEYNLVKENSITNYVRVFANKNLNFNSYTIEQQKSLLKVNVEFIEKVFEFLEKIDFEIKKDVINILLGTSLDIINNIDSFIKKGFLTNLFVKNNINIILSRMLSTQDGLYEILITNINILLKYGINIIDLDKESMEVFISDTNMIIQNLEIIDKFNVNIKTRNLKNYKFLLDDNLEEKITYFKENKIDIDFNLNLLNSDIKVLKRIKICKCIGLDIYENSKIRKEILDGNLFFIPDSKLDDYVVDDISELKLI